jgi:NTE family protein
MKSARAAGEELERENLHRLRTQAHGRNSNHQLQPPRIVTLAFLSEHLPASLISEQLARSLIVEAETSAVLVKVISNAGQCTGSNAAEPDVFLNGEFHMPPQLRRTETGFHELSLGVGEQPPSPAGIDSLMDQLGRRFRHVLIEVPAHEAAASWVPDFLQRSDLAFVFLQAATEDVYRLDVVMREVRERSANDARHIRSIACLAPGQQIDGFDLLALRVASPIHMFVRDCTMVTGSTRMEQQSNPGGWFAADVRRLARQVGGCLVGLALSSGAAKGLAHIGVIQVLEENGIEVDVVAGSSMGAYVGALWNFGCNGRELERLARELEVRWSLWSLLDPVFPPRQGFLRGFAVKKRLMRTLGHARFANLARPLRIVASNLATLERMAFCSGEVATAVHASIAVPGICVPVTIDGESYVDGGIVDPLPVDVLREMGASHIIAVDAIPTPDRIRYGLQAELELVRKGETRSRRLFRKVLPLDAQLNYFARGNLFEILMRSLHGAQIRVAEAACQRADLVLRPDICDDRWLDFRDPGKFITPGRVVAERHLEEIKALVARKEAKHEPAPEAVATIA